MITIHESPIKVEHTSANCNRVTRIAGHSASRTECSDHSLKKNVFSNCCRFFSPFCDKKIKSEQKILNLNVFESHSFVIEEK